MGCKARIIIREYIPYPDFSVSEENLTNWKLRMMRQEKLKSWNAATSGKDIKTTTKYYVSLPTEEAHHQTHQTEGIHGVAQGMHPKLAQKIRKLVSDGITELPTVYQMLQHYVNNDLCKEDKPSCSDRAYYPTKDDVKKYVYRAKKHLNSQNLTSTILN